MSSLNSEQDQGDFNDVCIEAHEIPIICIENANDSFLINDVKWSPDGTKFATVGIGKSIQIWSFSDGNMRKIKQFDDGTSEAIQSIQWSSNGKQIISGSQSSDGMLEYGTFSIWNVEDGIDEASQYKMRIDFYNDVCSVALTPDRKYAIVGCFRGGQLNIIEFNNFDNPFDFGNEKTIITIDDDDEHNYCINSIQTTNDSKYFIFTYYDGIQIWNIESKQCVLNVRDSQQKEVLVVKFSPNNTQFAMSTIDGRITVYDWNVEAGTSSINKEYQSQIDNNKPIISIDWSLDGSMIGAGTSNGDLFIWHLGLNHAIYANSIEDEEEDPISSINWSPDGKTIICCVGRNLYKIDASTIYHKFNLN